MIDLVINFALIVLASAAACLLLLLTTRLHGRHSMDHDLEGVQKLHVTPVPRIGGLAIVAGLFLGTLLVHRADADAGQAMLKLLVAGLPVFVAGLVEDLTKRVSIRTRLLASFVAAAIAAWLVGAHLGRLDMGSMVDPVMQLTWVSVLVTCFIVGGITHSINIIDGLNGLASGSVVIMLTGIGLLAWQAGDGLVMQLCATGVAACLGFMVFNFPAGRIFLGDGGAYLAGFWLAECAVLLLVRNPSVSGWAALLACLYPVWETVFSMYRRRVMRGTQVGRPDRVHLHQLVFRRLVCVRLGAGRLPALKHALAVPVLWLLVLCCQVFAQLGVMHGGWIALGAALFLYAYHGLYKAMLIRAQPTADASPARGSASGASTVRLAN
jgi:UDP-N-acetylmuramyl pentapeptide phosphotransferase/UDP-N-acetylglucosamine-1-phosphate transferase